MLHKILDLYLGRTFVVGDLHGCYEYLEAFMQYINFDYDKDTVIAVGDLIDRGPDSFKCLKLLEKPWFHSVMGNHEHMAISNKELWYDNGGDWFDSLNEAEKVETRVLLSQSLPYMITVNDKFHVIHADMPTPYTDEPDFKWFAQQLTRGWDVGSQKIIWGRELFYRQSAKNSRTVLESLKIPVGHLPVYCGHTPMDEPSRIGPFINIDTGAVYGGYLTVVDTSTNTFYGIDKYLDIKKVHLDILYDYE